MQIFLRYLIPSRHIDSGILVRDVRRLLPMVPAHAIYNKQLKGWRMRSEVGHVPLDVRND